MRIDRLTIENFKKFEKTTVELHRQFTLLVGDNGSGKTSLLDALAVALGIWHKGIPKTGWRNILEEEIRLTPVRAGDRTYFRPQLPTKITVEGKIGSKENLSWTRMIRDGGTRTINAGAREAEKAVYDTVQAALHQRALLPVLAYYGAGRAWSATNKRPALRTSQRKPQQFDPYRKCLDTPIRDHELNEWFLFEAVATNERGEERPGYRAVKHAVLQCIPDADNLRYDSDLKEIVLSIGRFEQPFYNLSAGQRMMVAMVADIAIKAVALNSYSYGPEEPGANNPMYVLRNSPGVVLIDELDVHLHPKWQRRIATDLKETFPSVQFVCTSHSPQVIGEVTPEEVRLLDGDQVTTPLRSFGIDSSRVLEELMDAKARDESVEQLLRNLFGLIDREDFEAARTLLPKVEAKIGPDDPEITRARSLMSFLESTA